MINKNIINKITKSIIVFSALGFGSSFGGLWRTMFGIAAVTNATCVESRMNTLESQYCKNHQDKVKQQELLEEMANIRQDRNAFHLYENPNCDATYEGWCIVEEHVITRVDEVSKKPPKKPSDECINEGYEMVETGSFPENMNPKSGQARLSKTLAFIKRQTDKLPSQEQIDRCIERVNEFEEKCDKSFKEFDKGLEEATKPMSSKILQVTAVPAIASARIALALSTPATSCVFKLAKEPLNCTKQMMQSANKFAENNPSNIKYFKRFIGSEQTSEHYDSTFSSWSMFSEQGNTAAMNLGQMD